MIALLFTGGTISMRFDPASGGAVPALSGRDILVAAGDLGDVSVEPEDWGAYPGPHMTVERQWALRGRIAELLGRPDVRGVVLTHGTDTPGLLPNGCGHGSLRPWYLSWRLIWSSCGKGPRAPTRVSLAAIQTRRPITSRA
jgi:hypothetical protein